MSKEKRLGRGLSALLGEESRKREAPEEIRIDRIVPNPHQPRRNFDEEALAELAASIRTHGVVQPVIVRRDADGYTLIAGERRLRASKLAGLTTMPAIVRDYNEEAAAEVALVENLQREDLNPVEEGRAYRRLMETYGYTQEKLAGIVGKSRPYVANLLRILALPEEVLARLEEESSPWDRCGPFWRSPRRRNRPRWPGALKRKISPPVRRKSWCAEKGKARAEGKSGGPGGVLFPQN